MITVRFYVSQHVDNAPGDYDVVECVQDWGSKIFPQDVKREVIHTGLTREYAGVLSDALNKAHRGEYMADYYAKRIEFILDCDENRHQAERIDIPAPMVY